MRTAAVTLTSPFGRPQNLSPTLFRDFDIFQLAGPLTDPHLALLAVQRGAAEIFWTARNGGHWVAIQADAIDAIL
jgi:hypothetical protein